MRNFIFALGMLVLVLIVCGIVSTVVSSLLASGNQTTETQGDEQAFKSLFIDGCIKGGEEYGNIDGFYEYCECSWDTYVENAGSWEEVASYSNNMTDAERTRVASTCMHHVKI